LKSNLIYKTFLNLTKLKTTHKVLLRNSAIFWPISLSFQGLKNF